MSINRAEVSGNLTRDPELRSTQGGTSVLTFGLAVNDRRKNSQTGEWEDYANYIDCVVFGNRAEWLGKELRKGKKVYLDGKLRYTSWERDGQKRSKIEIVVDDIDFDRPPKDTQAVQGHQVASSATNSHGYQNASQNRPQGRMSASSNQATQQSTYDDSDIPF